MNARIFFVLSAILIVLSFTFGRKECSAQWTRCNMNFVPPGGNATSMFISGNKIFAGTNDRGLIYSTDGGTHWDLSSMKKVVYSITESGNYLFAGTLNNGVYYSTDNGKTWNITTLRGKTIFCVTSNQNKIYAATESGLYSTSDYGQNWRHLNLVSENICTVSFLDGCLAAGSNSGLFKSTDEGLSWTKIFNGTSVTCIAKAGDRIFVGSNNHPSLKGLYVSYNNGTTWSLASLGYQRINTIIVQDTIYYAGTDSSIYYSSLNDTNWRKSSLTTFVRSAVIKENSIYVGTERDGVFKSDDNGQNWKSFGWESNYGLYSFATHNNNLIAFTNRGIYLSTNFGKSWSCTSKSSNMGMLLNDGKIYCPGWGITVSTDYGKTWERILDEKTYCNILAVTGKSIASEASGSDYNYHLICSNNGGHTWWWEGWQTNIYLASVGDLILAGFESQHFPHNTWHMIFCESTGGFKGIADFIHKNITSMTCSGRDIFFSTGTRGLYHSTDYCSTWECISDRNDLSLLKFISGNIYSKNPGGGLIRSSDMGKTWASWSDGFTNNFDIKSISAAGNYIFALTNENSIWRRAIAYYSKISNDIPQTISMNQNYPNPFNSVTNFSFNILKPEFIKLSIYDNSGREIEVLVSGSLDPGTYEAYWNASKYSSGVYFYRMKAGDFTDTKKMLLVK